MLEERVKMYSLRPEFVYELHRLLEYGNENN